MMSLKYNSPIKVLLRSTMLQLKWILSFKMLYKDNINNELLLLLKLACYYYYYICEL